MKEKKIKKLKKKILIITITIFLLVCLKHPISLLVWFTEIKKHLTATGMNINRKLANSIFKQNGGMYFLTQRFYSPISYLTSTVWMPNISICEGNT